MKNLLIYINPVDKKFSSEYETLTKIQIDNSLRLGWKPADILLVTNFDYEYNRVKAIVVGDENYCQHRPTCSKTNTIVTLFELGVIGNDLYWFHDFDAFQLEGMIDPKLGNADMGLMVYGEFEVGSKYIDAHRWNSGVIFFKKESKDIFEQIKESMYRYKVNDEIALVKVELKEKKKNPAFMDRVKPLNITYNFTTKTINEDLEHRYEIAEKPIKIIHFNPLDKRSVRASKLRMDVCVRGQNKMGKVLVSEMLINLFNQYGIK